MLVIEVMFSFYNLQFGSWREMFIETSLYYRSHSTPASEHASTGVKTPPDENVQKPLKNQGCGYGHLGTCQRWEEVPPLALGSWDLAVSLLVSLL